MRGERAKKGQTDRVNVSQTWDLLRKVRAAPGFRCGAGASPPVLLSRIARNPAVQEAAVDFPQTCGRWSSACQRSDLPRNRDRRPGAMSRTRRDMRTRSDCPGQTIIVYSIHKHASDHVCCNCINKSKRPVLQTQPRVSENRLL